MGLVVTLELDESRVPFRGSIVNAVTKLKKYREEYEYYCISLAILKRAHFIASSLQLDANKTTVLTRMFARATCPF